MSKTLHRKIRGRTIELDEDPGIPEGHEVEVTVRTPASTSRREPGDGFLRTEGALADDQEWDEIIEEIQRDRKRDTRQAIP
jgi:hypothetical protein